MHKAYFGNSRMEVRPYVIHCITMTGCLHFRCHQKHASLDAPAVLCRDRAVDNRMLLARPAEPLLGGHTPHRTHRQCLVRSTCCTRRRRWQWRSIGQSGGGGQGRGIVMAMLSGVLKGECGVVCGNAKTNTCAVGGLYVYNVNYILVYIA